MTHSLKMLCAPLCAAVALACASCASTDSENAAKNPEGSAPEGSVIGVDYGEEPVISYVRFRYLTDAQTRTIGEIFTGDEYTYGQLTLRSMPNKRAGMYFFVMFDYGPDEISLASQIELWVDSSDSAHPRLFVFSVPETHNVWREIKLGITGADWPDSKARVNAWKITVKSPSGKILTQKQSWLWSLRDPSGKKLGNPNLMKGEALPEINSAIPATGGKGANSQTPAKEPEVEKIEAPAVKKGS